MGERNPSPDKWINCYLSTQGDEKEWIIDKTVAGRHLKVVILNRRSQVSIDVLYDPVYINSKTCRLIYNDGKHIHGCL